jgi:hypothetical protein
VEPGVVIMLFSFCFMEQVLTLHMQLWWWNPCLISTCDYCKILEYQNTNCYLTEHLACMELYVLNFNESVVFLLAAGMVIFGISNGYWLLSVLVFQKYQLYRQHDLWWHHQCHKLWLCVWGELLHQNSWCVWRYIIYILYCLCLCMLTRFSACWVIHLHIHD